MRTGRRTRPAARNLCLAGGVALNSKANGKILASGLVDDIFVQPAAADDGVRARRRPSRPILQPGSRLPLTKASGRFTWAPLSKTRKSKNVLRTYKLRCDAARAMLPRTTAELLAAGKIIGWFQGRMEFGPRALGSRSILADPRDPEMNAKVNNAVKFREWWRPFAPSLLAEAAGEYLEMRHDSPFMILTNPVQPGKARRHSLP